jgi:hypothetical protein
VRQATLHTDLVKLLAAKAHIVDTCAGQFALLI